VSEWSIGQIVIGSEDRISWRRTYTNASFTNINPAGTTWELILALHGKKPEAITI
jgi:hypothetical protein